MDRFNRIIFSGAHSVGKTTLVNEVARTCRRCGAKRAPRFDLQNTACSSCKDAGHDVIFPRALREVPREVMTSMELKLDAIRGDLELSNTFQRAVFDRQVEKQLAAGDNYVSDRGPDALAYATLKSTIVDELLAHPRLPEYVEHCKASTIFFVHGHPGLLAADAGNRVSSELTMEEIRRVEGAALAMFAFLGIKRLHHIYVPDLSARVQEVMTTLADVGGF